MSISHFDLAFYAGGFLILFMTPSPVLAGDYRQIAERGIQRSIATHCWCGCRRYNLALYRHPRSSVVCLQFKSLYANP